MVLNKIAQCFPSGIMQFLNQHTSKYKKRSKHFVCTRLPGMPPVPPDYNLNRLNRWLHVGHSDGCRKLNCSGCLKCGIVHALFSHRTNTHRSLSFHRLASAPFVTLGGDATGANFQNVNFHHFERYICTTVVGFNLPTLPPTRVITLV